VVDAETTVDTDDLEHDRRLERAPKGEVGIEVDVDVEVLFLFTDRLCAKLDAFSRTSASWCARQFKASMHVLITLEKSETKAFLASSESN